MFTYCYFWPVVCRQRGQISSVWDLIRLITNSVRLCTAGQQRQRTIRHLHTHTHTHGQQPGGKSLLSLDALCCGCDSPLVPPAVGPSWLSAALLQETRYNRLEKQASPVLSVPAIVPP